MTRNLTRAATIVVSCLAAACAARAEGCTNSTFNGIYSALVTGSFVTAPVPGVPTGATARVGRVHADGAGVSKITATLSLLGFIFQENYGGNYTIRPDCTADVILGVLFPGSSTPYPFNFVGTLTDGGNMMQLILVDPQGTDLRIDLQRQPKSTCATSDLNGVYALNVGGSTFMTPIGPNGLFARVGQVTFDGVGGFSASVHTSYDGAVIPEIFSGTYTVDSTCILHTNYTLYSFDSGWTGVLYGGSAGVKLLVSGPQGSVVTGYMTAVSHSTVVGSAEQPSGPGTAQ